MAENIEVEPSRSPNAVEVNTVVKEGVHTPVYQTSNDDIDRNSSMQETLDNILIQLKTLNAYMAEGFDETKGEG